MDDYFLVNVGSPQKPNVYAKISPEDAERVLLYKWSFSYGKDGKYYVRTADRTVTPPRQIKLHRFLLQADDAHDVDHKNGDTLDNRRCNIRLATKQQNMANQRKQDDTSSFYKGVSWHKKAQKWRATICMDKKQEHLGFFEDQIDAARAYDKRAVELFGAFAWCNLSNNA